jgi:hypothetical protein
MSCISCWQGRARGLCLNLDESSEHRQTRISLWSIYFTFIWRTHLFLGLPNIPFSSLSRILILHFFPTCDPMPATFPTHISLSGLVILIIFGDEYELRRMKIRLKQLSAAPCYFILVGSKCYLLTPYLLYDLQCVIIFNLLLFPLYSPNIRFSNRINSDVGRMACESRLCTMKDFDSSDIYWTVRLCYLRVNYFK